MTEHRRFFRFFAGILIVLFFASGCSEDVRSEAGRPPAFHPIGPFSKIIFDNRLTIQRHGDSYDERLEEAMAIDRCAGAFEPLPMKTLAYCLMELEYCPRAAFAVMAEAIKYGDVESARQMAEYVTMGTFGIEYNAETVASIYRAGFMAPYTVQNNGDHRICFEMLCSILMAEMEVPRYDEVAAFCNMAYLHGDQMTARIIAAYVIFLSPKDKSAFSADILHEVMVNGEPDQALVRQGRRQVDWSLGDLKNYAKRGPRCQAEAKERARDYIQGQREAAAMERASSVNWGAVVINGLSQANGGSATLPIHPSIEPVQQARVATVQLGQNGSHRIADQVGGDIGTPSAFKRCYLNCAHDLRSCAAVEGGKDLADLMLKLAAIDESMAAMATLDVVGPAPREQIAPIVDGPVPGAYR